MSGILDIETLRGLKAKATPGPWEADTEHNEGYYGSGPDCVSGFQSSMILGPDGLSLFDALNSTASVIHEDCADEDGYVHAWDETSAANAALIVYLVNSIPEILAMMEREEAREAELAAVKTERDGLREALFEAAALIGHKMPMNTTALVAGETLTAKDVHEHARQALKGTIG